MVDESLVLELPLESGVVDVGFPLFCLLWRRCFIEELACEVPVLDPAVL